MSSNRYLEICSEYRDRNRFPKPGQFEIPISQSGRKDISNAIDPVCLSTPVTSWTCNNLSTSVPNLKTILCTVEPKTTNLSGVTDTSVFIINSFNTSAPTLPERNFRLQKLENYYVGLIIEDAAFFNRRRIKTYRFLGSFTNYDRAEITVDTSFPETFIPTNNVFIYDPSDISIPTYPIFFVPNGRNRENAYSNYYLYNETLNDYRNIENYDVHTHCALLKTTDLGPVTGWNLNHNYSLRKEKPFIPLTNASNPTIVSSTLSSIELNYNINADVNKFIRILPTVYNYNLTGEDNECRRITAYNSSTNTVTVFPPFSGIPTIGKKIEILNFSYDNLCPFVYTGSLLSQQELVCYEIELLSLIIPSEILKVAEGGYITYYPYVYVELSNTCSAGHRNIIYSNNPNATKMTFRVPMFDIQDSPVFIKVGGGMSQTIKFKPNDTLLFSVTLPNGEILDTIVPEKFSPSQPEPRIQISALFSMRRLV